MIIGFTGHRDRYAPIEFLDALWEEFPGVVWLHGGAYEGFDHQVMVYANSKQTPNVSLRPAYRSGRYTGGVAPLIRNELIVTNCDLLIACYDERMNGGTYQTVLFAQGLKKAMRIWDPVAALKRLPCSGTNR